MKRKLLAATLVIAGALMLPTMAAQDTSGMRYTSASEGFYASLRVQFNSGGTENAGFAIENSTSRFGVQGTNDLGNGLQGFYQYESEVDIDNSGELETRLAHVGLRGGFGQLQVGSFWPASYNWVHGSTDVANWASGSFIHTMLLPGRQSRALEYTTPDISGFQAAVFIEMDPNRDGEGALAPPTTTTTVSTSNSYLRGAVFLRASEYGTATMERREELLREYLVSPALLAGPRYFNNEVPTPAVDRGIGSGDSLTETVVGRRLRLTLDVTTTMTVTSPPPSYYFVDPAGGSDDLVIFGIRSFTTMTVTRGNSKDDNDIDLWSLSAKYSVLGFDTGISYTVAPDGLEKNSGGRKDLSLYALRLGYAQDNWYVNGWYAEDNAGDDTNREHDTETFSLAAGVAVGKANLYAVYEQQELDNYAPETTTSAEVASTGSHDDESATVGMQYNLGARSRAWIEYVDRDYDSKEVDDYINIGLRHDL